MSPWRPPGGVPGDLWPALGRGGRILSDFRCLLGGLLGSPKGSTSVLKLHLKSSSASERHFDPLGAVLGSILGSFWGRLGLCFAVRWPNTKTLIFDDPLTRNRVFSGLWASKISPKSVPRASWHGTWLQGRLGGLLGSIFGPFGGPKMDPKGV